MGSDLLYAPCMTERREVDGGACELSVVKRWRAAPKVGQFVPGGDRPMSIKRLGPDARLRSTFPPPAHQTGRAHFEHPAFGQEITLSPTGGCSETL